MSSSEQYVYNNHKLQLGLGPHHFLKSRIRGACVFEPLQVFLLALLIQRIVLGDVARLLQALPLKDLSRLAAVTVPAPPNKFLDRKGDRVKRNV